MKPPCLCWNGDCDFYLCTEDTNMVPKEVYIVLDLKSETSTVHSLHLPFDHRCGSPNPSLDNTAFWHVHIQSSAFGQVVSTYEKQKTADIRSAQDEYRSTGCARTHTRALPRAYGSGGVTSQGIPRKYCGSRRTGIVQVFLTPSELAP